MDITRIREIMEKAGLWGKWIDLGLYINMATKDAEGCRITGAISNIAQAGRILGELWKELDKALEDGKISLGEFKFAVKELHKELVDGELEIAKLMIEKCGCRRK